LKIKGRAEFVSRKQTDLGVEKAQFLGKKRSFLTFNGAISSPLHTISGD
jgi:carbonic anhydrase